MRCQEQLLTVKSSRVCLVLVFFSFDLSTSFLYLGCVHYDAAQTQSLLRWSRAWQLWLVAL